MQPGNGLYKGWFVLGMVRIRACLQACRKCCVLRAPSGAEAGDSGLPLTPSGPLSCLERNGSLTKLGGSSSAVERQLPKLDVTGSIPVSRSIVKRLFPDSNITPLPYWPEARVGMAGVKCSAPLASALASEGPHPWFTRCRRVTGGHAPWDICFSAPPVYHRRKPDIFREGL
jgi:hypothetical protein